MEEIEEIEEKRYDWVAMHSPPLSCKHQEGIWGIFMNHERVFVIIPCITLQLNY